jgi:hypothetical protein
VELARRRDSEGGESTHGETEGETMNQSFWRMVVTLIIAAVLVLAARYFGWSHTPISVE